IRVHSWFKNQTHPDLLPPSIRIHRRPSVVNRPSSEFRSLISELRSPMHSFIHDDFLLETDAARDLYHHFAKDEPIYDYHCHLPPQQIVDNHQFADLSEIWLG